MVQLYGPNGFVEYIASNEEDVDSIADEVIDKLKSSPDESKNSSYFSSDNIKAAIEAGKEKENEAGHRVRLKRYGPLVYVINRLGYKQFTVKTLEDYKKILFCLYSPIVKGKEEGVNTLYQIMETADAFLSIGDMKKSEWIFTKKLALSILKSIKDNKIETGFGWEYSILKLREILIGKEKAS